MKLFAFHPIGFAGPDSFFVVAETEESARAAESEAATTAVGTNGPQDSEG